MTIFPEYKWIQTIYFNKHEYTFNDKRNETSHSKTIKQFLYQPVIPQMILSPERFTTDVTWEGSFVRVRPLVDKEIVTLGEMPTTVLTDKLLLCSLNV